MQVPLVELVHSGPALDFTWLVCMWRKRLPLVAPILLGLAAALVSSCGRQMERSTPIARCTTGTLRIDETIFERESLTRTELAIERRLHFLTADGRRVPIEVSDRASYRPPSDDRLAVLREPREGDWHAYVDPAAIDERGYQELIRCLRVAAAQLSPPKTLAPVPVIATLRHANIKHLRKRYDCADDASLAVREDGRVYFQSDSGVLVGLIRDGSVLVLDATALHYLSSRDLRAIPDPLSHFKRCIDRSGRSLFDEFGVVVEPEYLFWARLQRR